MLGDGDRDRDSDRHRYIKGFVKVVEIKTKIKCIRSVEK
jgi:hypothetical protein